jgi:hypothetical protein
MVKAAEYRHTDKAAQVCPMYGAGYYRDAKRKRNTMGSPDKRFAEATAIKLPFFDYLPLTPNTSISAPFHPEKFRIAAKVVFKMNAIFGQEYWLIKSHYVAGPRTISGAVSEQVRVMSIFTLSRKA